MRVSTQLGTLEGQIANLADQLEAEREFRRWLSEDLDDAFDRIDALEARVREAFGYTEPISDEEFLRRMIEIGVTVEFRYTREDGEISTRTVSPYELRPNGHGPNLFGWDHEREGIRQYRLERIRELGPGNGEFRQPEVAE